MGKAEKEGGWPVSGTHSKQYFLLTAKITARVLGKIGSHMPSTEGLNLCLGLPCFSLGFTKITSYF